VQDCDRQQEKGYWRNEAQWIGSDAYAPIRLATPLSAPMSGPVALRPYLAVSLPLHRLWLRSRSIVELHCLHGGT